MRALMTACRSCRTLERGDAMREPTRDKMRGALSGRWPAILLMALAASTARADHLGPEGSGPLQVTAPSPDAASAAPALRFEVPGQ